MRLIEIPDDGIIKEFIWRGDSVVGKRRIDLSYMPTIKAEPVRHGRWEEKFFTNDRQRVCSVCHCTVRQPSYDKGETALFKYCPHCGAKMDGEQK